MSLAHLTNSTGRPAIISHQPVPQELSLSLGAALFGSEASFNVEGFPTDSRYSLSAFRDGIWERRKTELGYFTYQKHKFDILGLNTCGSFDFQMVLPKIPLGFFDAIKDFFTIVCEKWDDEVMVQVFWKKSEERYYIFVPEQKVSKASIIFDRNHSLMQNTDFLWVMDYHSHNSMAAFWSGTDNGDEISPRLYGVFGTLNKDPTYRLRAGFAGQFKDLTLEDVFDIEDSRKFFIEKDNLQKISKLSSVQSYYRQNGSTSAYNYSAGPNNYQYVYGANRYSPSGQNDSFWKFTRNELVDAVEALLGYSATDHFVKTRVWAENPADHVTKELKKKIQELLIESGFNPSVKPNVDDVVRYDDLLDQDFLEEIDYDYRPVSSSRKLAPIGGNFNSRTIEGVSEASFESDEDDLADDIMDSANLYEKDLELKVEAYEMAVDNFEQSMGEAIESFFARIVTNGEKPEDCVEESEQMIESFLSLIAESEIDIDKSLLPWMNVLSDNGDAETWRVIVAKLQNRWAI
jgi:hypothetical protein